MARRLTGALFAALLWGAQALVAAADPAEVAAKVCAACHGPDGNSALPAHPRLAGMDPEYLLRQLRAFAAGKRRDESMAAVIANLDPGDFAGLAAFYGAKAPARGSVTDATLAAKGRAVYDDGNTDSGVPACAGCHQPDGRGNARFPRLAGQNPAYVLKQLADYGSGRRATDPLMTTVGKRLTEDEMKAVAEYISGL